MDNKPGQAYRRLWLYAGIAMALGAVAMPVLNPDLFWHLSAARYMVHNLRLPSADFLSWTEYGAPWKDFEWLTQLLWYAVYSAAGIKGLFVFKTALLATSFPLLYLALPRNIGKEVAFIALPLWGLALMANSDLRPENFSVLFFAALLWKLETARRNGGTWPRGPAGLAGLALLFALWANLHAGFAFGLLLLASYAAGGLERTGPKAPLLALGAAFSGTLLNPWGIGLYSVLYKHAVQSAALSRYLSEWEPPSLLIPWHWPFTALLAGAAALLLLRYRRSRRVPPEHLLTLAWLAFEALSHTRHIVFFSMAAVVFSFDAAASLWEPARLIRTWRWLAVLAAVYLSAVVWPRYLSFRTSIGGEAAGAAAYLEANKALLGGRRLYNPWTWGGYLGWALAPDYQVFTDGRYIFHKYLVPESEAMKDQYAWEKFSDQENFGLALFRRDYQMLPYGQRTGGGMAKIMRPSYLLFMPAGKWALVYWDAFSVLFARRGGPLPPEFRILRPDDFGSAELKLCDGAVGKEAAEGELKDYYKAAAGAPSTREADYFRDWLKGFPGSCPPRVNRPAAPDGQASR